MSQESAIYLVNLIIGVILSALLTQHWRQAPEDGNLRFWMLAAWTLTAADTLFTLRPVLPYWVGRFFPTLLVTVGHAVLLLGARHTAGRPGRPALAATIVLVHAAALALFLAVDGGSAWRTVTNGLLWGGISLAAGLVLLGAPATLRRIFAIPAAVLLAHGAFHALRTLLATAVAVRPGAGSEWLQLLGDIEVSFFMVALFVSLLVAHLRLANEALRGALLDVQQLAELLPICAWCRKVRNDDGYWDRIETYFATRRGVRFTHGICESCNAEQLAAEAADAR